MWMAPAFLAGLLAIGLPLWLHRFARRTDERRPFASLMLIEPAVVRRSRRHELRYWLLLLLRIGLLAALAMAFAGPLLPRRPDAVAAREAQLHLIVMDVSLSMRRGDSWARAQARAGDIIDALRGSDRGALIAADHRIRVLQEAVFASDAGALRAALGALTPGASRLDYGGLMAAASSLASGAGQPVVLHVVTDLQASASPARFADLQPPPGVTVDVIDVGAEGGRNLRVADVAFAQASAGAVDVRLDGDLPAGVARELTLSVDGTVRGRRALDPARAAPYSESFIVGDLGEGEHRLVAALSPGDDLAADDAHYALLRRVEPRVLVVATSLQGDDASYLRAALGALEAPRFRVEVVDAAGLARRALTDYAAIVVADAGLLAAPAAEALRRHVASGGALLLVLGERALQQRSVPVGGETVTRASGTARDAGAARVGEVEQSHPVLREAGDWRVLRFFRHVPVTPRDGEHVLLRLDDGAPLLLEQRMGSGRVLTLASALDRSWNDLAIHPQFVRFIAEATAWLSGSRAEGATATVGQVVTVDLGGRAGAQAFAPDGKRALMLEGAAGERRLAPEQPGFYELRGGGRSEWIAVNTDPRESQLERLSPQRLAQWRALRAQPIAQSEPVAGAPAGTGGWLPVWFWCLLAAAALALAEPLVANYHLAVRREQAT
jgi:hypothetical protein